MGLILPYDASTYSKSWVAYGKRPPLHVTHSDGWLTFADGKDYLDMVMGLGSVILGHCHPHVDEAIRQQLSRGTAQSLGTHLEIEAAERVLAHFPDGCMLQWGTNGSDATEGACRLARLLTECNVICMYDDGYHGFHDWCLTDTLRGEGIPTGECEGVYNVMPAGPDRYMSTSEAPHYVAGVIVEPDQHPEDLKQLREWCTRHGKILIFDEVMTWQRYPEWTASAHYGVTPDLWCLGKSLGNGMPVSAIVGPRDILKRFAPPAPNAFFSSTWAGHPLSMAAVTATLDVMEKEKGCERLWQKAQDVSTILDKYATKFGGITHDGAPPWNRCGSIVNDNVTREIRNLMASRGVLIYSAHNVSLAHDKAAFTRLDEAWEAVLETLPEHLDARQHQEEEDHSAGIMRR